MSARLVPKRSVWTSIATRAWISSTPVRSASDRSAWVVLLPARTSRVTSSNSAASVVWVRANSFEIR